VATFHLPLLVYSLLDCAHSLSTLHSLYAVYSFKPIQHCILSHTVYDKRHCGNTLHEAIVGPSLRYCWHTGARSVPVRFRLYGIQYTALLEHRKERKGNCTETGMRNARKQRLVSVGVHVENGTNDYYKQRLMSVGVHVENGTNDYYKQTCAFESRLLFSKPHVLTSP